MHVLRNRDRLRVVGIGGKIEQPDVLRPFFEAFPTPPEASFIVVSRTAPSSWQNGVDALQALTELPVQPVEGTVRVEANRVYVASPGQTLLMQGRDLVAYDIDEAEDIRTLDRFFESLVQPGIQPVGVLVSGERIDGGRGLRRIADSGGLVAVEDPREASQGEGLRHAIETASVDCVLPVSELARRIGAHREQAHSVPTTPEELTEHHSTVLGHILDQVRNQTGHDFQGYRRATILRRLHRRVQVQQITTLSAYLEYVRDHPEEAEALGKDLLISVTSFFRNPDTFAAVRDRALSDVMAAKADDDPLRVWVVGCATGEEAYSITMLLLEQAAAVGIAPDRIQVFASDLNEDALEMARAGTYPASVLAEIPDAYRDRFVRREGNRAIVREAVRERILFTKHGLFQDPPFLDLDLVCCRNLLIYLRRSRQVSALDIFQYALGEDGYLFLGEAESVEGVSSAFETVDKKSRLYQRRAKVEAEPPELPLRTSRRQSFGREKGTKREESSYASLHQRMLEAYAPASAVVDESGNILHLSASVGRYLTHSAGPPSMNLVDVARPELRTPLRRALRDAFDTREQVCTPPIRVSIGEDDPVLCLEVRPETERLEKGRAALVVFQELETALPSTGPRTSSQETERQQLKHEFKETRRELWGTRKKYDTTREEMQAANEELRSMNEEYKSIAEELETSRADLRSMNHELSEINQELQQKVKALQETKDDLENLIAATNIGILFLDRRLTIQRHTERIDELFGIQDEDVGRPIGDLSHRLEYDQFEADARSVLTDPAPVEREVCSDDARWFRVRHHPYRKNDDTIDGVVVTFVDITQRKDIEEERERACAALRERNEQVQTLVESLTAAEEAERKRLSQLLHDNLQQTLFAARVKVENLQAQASLESEHDRLAGEASDLLEEGIKITRSLSAELSPSIGDRSVRELFDWLAIRMQEAYGLAVAVHSYGDPTVADQTLRTLLFRAVRELLFNVVKHAEVDEAELVLREHDPDTLRVVVADDGVGFDPDDEWEREGGRGLMDVLERIEMVGGWVEVDAAPGSGTRIVMELPRKGEAGMTVTSNGEM